ncbi:MAG TPA: chitosanase, partial [Streptomyces sp.]|nr:chitosanase [Streptomyces sp.]
MKTKLLPLAAALALALTGCSGPGPGAPEKGLDDPAKKD